MERTVIKDNWKKIALALFMIFFIYSLNIDGRGPNYRTEFNADTVYVRQVADAGNDKFFQPVDTIPADTVKVAEVYDVPMRIARLIGDNLILSTEGLPLDATMIRAKIDEEEAKRASGSVNFQQSYCKESMVYFNIADDWAQIITFKRKDNTYLVFLIQYYDWHEGYGIISSRYFNFDGESLSPTSNPLKRFAYLANNKDTIGVRYDFRTIKQKYDPTRLKLNTAMQDVELGKVQDIINAEFLWTGRDFIELASDHTMPKREDIVRIWKNAMPGDAELPGQYARTDIDSDGNDEYIFRVNDGSDNKFAIFTFLNDKLNLLVGNYGSDKKITMQQGGFVVLTDNDQVRHFHLMGSVIDGIYNKSGNSYTYRADKGSVPEEISQTDYQKVIRRARRNIEFSSLDWRFWSVETAK